MPIFLISLFSVLVICSHICPKYICGQSAENFCLYVVNNQTMPSPNSFTFIASQCPMNQYCELSFNYPSQAVCVNQTLAVPGEPCNDNSSCVTGYCNNMTCTLAKPTTNGSVCITPYMCDIGYVCKGGVCKQQQDIGGYCSDSLDCISYMICNNGQCQLIGSVAIGSTSDDIWGCNTLYGSYANGKYLCSNGPRLQSDENCVYGQTCKYTTSSGVVENPCECTMSTEGRAICPKGVGNMKDEVQYLIGFITKYKPLCHYTKPIICNNTAYFKTSDYASVYIAYNRITRYSSFISNPTCVENGIHKVFWNYYNQLQHTSKYLSISLLITTAALLSAAVIAICLWARRNAKRNKERKESANNPLIPSTNPI